MKSPEEIAAGFIARGRAYVKSRAVYVSKTLLALAPVPVYEVETLGVTEGLVLYYNPLFFVHEPSFYTVDKLGVNNGHEVVGACLYHECWHPLRGIERLRALPDPKLANLAGDLCINHDLRVAGWRLPAWVVYPETFGLKPGLTLEQYYAQLQNNQQAQQMLAEASTGQGQGGRSGKGEGNKKGNEPRIGPCSGQCGGVAGNPINADLEKELDAKYGRHPAEREQIKKATQRDINSYIQAHGRGSATGFSEEKIEFKKEEFGINWRRELRHAFTRATGRVEMGGTSYSYAHPSRRSTLLGIVRPGLVSRQISFTFIRDTSGSMSQHQLNSANNVIVSIMRKLGVHQVWLLDADTEVKREPTLVTLKDIPHLEAKGRGGTSFIQPLEAVSKLKPKPDICVYLTDGDGTAPEGPPKGLEVIWCIVPTPYGRRPARWGRMVVCSNDQNLRDPYC